MSYLCDLHYDQSYNFMNTDTLVFFTYSLDYVMLFLDDNLDEECE